MKAVLAGLAAVLVSAATVSVALPLLFLGAPGPGGGAAATTAAPSTVALTDIPPVLLPHYLAAPACEGLPWQVVAAVGWVESRHARAYRDPLTGEWRGIDATGRTESRIVGPALDGSGGTRAIPATPESAENTGDARWDHAVGPMQFLTSTFDAWAVDGNGDGRTDPHNAFDAVATAGRHLCNGAHGLNSVEAALRRYNNSARYVAAVQAKALAYGMAPWGGAPGGGRAGPAGGVLVGGDLRPVVAFALAQLGEPYRWGATGPDRWDCSGLTQAAYAIVGVPIGRTTAQQVHVGEEVDWRTEPLRPGDLVFTPSGDRPLGHVGMALDATHWIVAPHTGDVVRIAPVPFGAVGAVRRVVEP